MSHIVEIRPKIYDLHALKQAIKKLGGTVHEDRKKYRAYSRSEACDLVATFPGSSWELGIIKQGNEYALKYDTMLEHKIGYKASKLMDAYNIEKSRYEAEMMGYIASEEYLEKDGTRVLEIIVEGF